MADTDPIPTPDPLPDGLGLARTTPEFTAQTVPPKLLAAHRTAEGVWGHLVVRSGSVDFVFEDDPDHVHHVEPGSPMPIPPGRAHRLTPSDDAVFAVEFHRPAL